MIKTNAILLNVEDITELEIINMELNMQNS